MKKQYKLTALALTACLLTGCGAGETIVLENTTAEKQLTEDVASESKSVASTEAVTIDTPETFSVSDESSFQEGPAAPKEITIDFTGIAEFHPEGTPAQPYSLKILSETDNNVTMAYEWYDAADDVSLPMIGESWDCFYDENYTYQWDDGKLSIFDGENCLYVLEYPTDNGTSTATTPALRTGSSMGLR